MIITYDISEDKLRTQFSHFLEKYGRRLQYSVFEVKNSNRLLNIICSEIENYFGKKFSERDSVYIFVLSEWCKTIKYGYAQNDDNELIII